MIETRRLKNVVIFIQTVLSFVLSRKTRQFIFCTKLMKIVHSITRGLSLSQINYFSIRDRSRYPVSVVMLNLPQSLGKNLACKTTPLLKKFEFSTSHAYYIILFTPVTFHINPLYHADSPWCLLGSCRDLWWHFFRNIGLIFLVMMNWFSFVFNNFLWRAGNCNWNPLDEDFTVW